MKKITVIIAHCVGTTPDNLRTYGDSLRFHRNDMDEAREFGEIHKGEGICVIVRPNYNEEDETGRFFREWRSFHGGEFTECRWEVF